MDREEIVGDALLEIIWATLTTKQRFEVAQFLLQVRAKAREYAGKKKEKVA